MGNLVAELAGSGTVADDWFGESVAVSGGTVVVGAPAEPLVNSGVGRAFVYTRTAKGWVETAELQGPDPGAHDWFGDSVAISGSTIVVGAPAISILSSGIGAAYVFTQTTAGWQRTAQLEGPEPAAADLFGASVAVAGSTIVVGAPGQASKAGAVYVFTKALRGWQATELRSLDIAPKDNFGDAVALSGGAIIAGAFAHASLAGRAYLFNRGPAGWRQTAELAGAGTVAGDGFGVSVALAGKTVVVGAGLAAGAAGRAYVFGRTATGWRQTAELTGPGTVTGDCFGDSVATTGRVIVVGAFQHASSAGRVYLFARSTSGWRQAAQLAGPGEAEAGNEFGYSVAVDGATAVAGAVRARSAGRAYIYHL